MKPSVFFSFLLLLSTQAFALVLFPASSDLQNYTSADATQRIQENIRDAVDGYCPNAMAIELMINDERAGQDDHRDFWYEATVISLRSGDSANLKVTSKGFIGGYEIETLVSGVCPE